MAAGWQEAVLMGKTEMGVGIMSITGARRKR
jgi:hypothetical protein